MALDRNQLAPSDAESIVGESLGMDFGGALDDNAGGTEDDFDVGGGQDDGLDTNVDADGGLGFDENDESDPFAEPQPGNEDGLDEFRLSQTPGRDQRRPLPKGADVKADRSGNLRDKNGKIVAKAGAEARLYTSLHKARQEVGTLRTDAQTAIQQRDRVVEVARGMQRELETFKAHAEAMKNFNFTPDDQITAMKLYSDLTKDTEGTLKKLLTRAAAAGINVTGSNSQNGNGNGIDMKSIVETIKGELNKELAPLRQREQQSREEQQRQQQEREAAAAVQREIGDFFNRNPEAKKHIDTFKRVWADPRYAKWSIGEVWAKIVENRMRNPQADRGARRPSSRQTPRKQIMRGRSAPPILSGSDMAEPNATYDSILNGVLDQHLQQ